MKKLVVILLILFLVGCIPPDISSRFGKGKLKSIMERGLNIEVLEPKFKYQEGKNVLEVGKSFNVVLKLSHNLVYSDVSGELLLTSTSGIGEKLITEARSDISIEGAEVEGEHVESNSQEIFFGPYQYSDGMKNQPDGLEIDAKVNYEGFVNAEICVVEEENFGCVNDETITIFGGDNSVLPIAIHRIEKISSGSDFDLDIYLRDFGRGKILGEITGFNAILDDGNINCGEIIFKDKEWKVNCEGSKSIGESRISFEFDYVYNNKEVIAFNVVE